MLTPNRASLSMFSRWIAENGVSRGTITRSPRSLMTTSAARSSRFSLAPVAIADSVAMLAGQTTMRRGAPEPLASGEVHSSSPNTRSWPSRALNSADRWRVCSAGRPGRRQSVSEPMTICAARVKVR